MSETEFCIWLRDYLSRKWTLNDIEMAEVEDRLKETMAATAGRPFTLNLRGLNEYPEN